MLKKGQEGEKFNPSISGQDPCLALAEGLIKFKA